MQEQNPLDLAYAIITVLVNRVGGQVEITSKDLMETENTPGNITKTPDGIIVKVGK